MRKYDYVLFDIDDTLLDYGYAERNIMTQIFKSEEKCMSEKVYRGLWDLSWLYWDKYHLSDSEDMYIQENYHRLYRRYLDELMKNVKERYGFESTGRELSNAFLHLLMNEAQEYSDTELVLQYCSNNSKIAIASNGLGNVQRSRINKYNKYISKVFISEELGVIKPSRIFWDKVFADIGAEPGNCLMVGDSFCNDIISASAYGMETCWINRSKKRTSDSPNLRTDSPHRVNTDSPYWVMLILSAKDRRDDL